MNLNYAPRCLPTTSKAFMVTLVIYILCNFTFTIVAAQRPKILCLHGGGGNQYSIAAAVTDIANALPEYEFVYVNGAYGDQNNYLWIRDPPGGKNQPTTDPGWADESIQVLDDILEAQGPFHGILGYSQGAAFVPVYLSRVPNDTFRVAITFCGYLTTTHLGLLDIVQERSPFGNISHLVWMGGNDFIISNSMTREMAAEFISPSIIESNAAGHVVPGSNDPTFEQVVSWIRSPTSSPTESPVASTTPAPTSSTTSSCGDSTLRFKLTWNSKKITRGCDWVANKATVQRCAVDGVSAMCSDTCGTCSTCADSNVRMKFTWNDKKITRDCGWVANKATLQRCAVDGIANSCRATCGQC